MPPTQTVEQRNRALQDAGVTQSQIDQNAITASQLGGVASPFQVPEFTPTSPDQVKNEIAGIPTYQDLFDRVYGQKSGAEQTGSDLAGTLLGEYKSIIEKGGFVNEDGTINTDQARAQQEIQAGIPEQERQALNLSNQLTALQSESLAIPSLIQEQFTGRGATQAGVEPIQTAELRRNLIKSLSVSAQLQAVQGNIALARQQVDRAIQAEFQPFEARLSLVSKAYELNKDELERQDAQKAQRINALIKDTERQLAEEKERRTQINNVLIKSAGKAPQDVLSKIEGARTIGEAVGLAAPYLVDDTRDTQIVQLDNGDTVLIDKQTGETVKNFGGRKEENLIADYLGIPGAEYGTPEFSYNKILQSSQFGDTRLNDSRLEKLDQAKLALGSLTSLTSLIQQGEDGVKLTGPLTGRVRGLMSALGGDAQAGQINALIQGLIPTVARGIFGEVGVLTDTDIENYKKTVPNLNTPEEQNKLVSLVLYDVLSRTFENTLVNSAQNQTNVSGFAQDYLMIRERVEQEKLKLGVTQYNGLENDEFLDSTPDANTDGYSINNIFNSFMNSDYGYGQ